VKAKSRTATSRSGTRRGARRAKAKAKATAKASRPTARRATAKPAGKRTARRPAKRAPARRGRSGPARSGPARSGPARSKAGRRAPGERWLAFVEQHGVVLASARGPVPSVAEAVAGQPIIGSWWAHPRGKAIFAALSELDDSHDVRCFKLIDGKVTFVHRRVWPALACLARNGAIAAERAAAIQQEHMPTGEHRNLVTPYPDWVPDDVARAAAALTVEAARAQLGAWV